MALPRLSKAPSSGFGYPLDGISHLTHGNALSVPHAHGLHPPELCSDLVANPRFLKSSPLLRFLVKPYGLTPTLQRFPLTKPAALPAPGAYYGARWSHCSPGLRHLPGSLSLNIERSSFLLSAPLVLSLPTSEDADNWNLRGFLPATQRFPSFKGRPPAWRS
jgi:hypothetical protein